MHRRGFTLLEALLVIGILGGLSAIALPAYRDYQIRNDLTTAAEQISQALGRAQLLAQSGKNESAWGFAVTPRTLFAGETYAERLPEHDEHYQFPLTVANSGLTEVSFSRLTGIPSATGTIVLTSLRGEEREVQILIDRQGIAINLFDRLTVCHCASGTPHSLKIPEAAWPAHRSHGDYLGACRPVNPFAYCNANQ